MYINTCSVESFETNRCFVVFTFSIKGNFQIPPQACVRLCPRNKLTSNDNFIKSPYLLIGTTYLLSLNRKSNFRITENCFRILEVDLYTLHVFFTQIISTKMHNQNVKSVFLKKILLIVRNHKGVYNQK